MAGVVVLLTAWVLFCFAPIALLRAVNVQDDIYTSDLLNDRLPARAFVGESFARGELPLWSPGIYTGFPMLAQVEVGALYPSNALLFGLLPPYVAIAYAQLLPLALIGVGTGLLALAYGLPFAPALLAGGSVALSGFFVCHIRQLNLIDAACWLPFLLLAIERGLAGARIVGPLALVWGLSLLAGHPQMSYYTALVVAGYALFRARQIDRPSTPPLLAWVRGLPTDRRLWRLAAGVAIGTAIAAAQLLPAIELMSLGHRQGGISWEMAAAFAVSPQSLWSFLIPYINGDASDRSFELSGIFWEQYGYLGLVPMLLAILAVVVERRDPRVRTLAAIAVVSCLLLLGPNTPVFPIAFSIIPGMSYFRFPARFLVFVELAVALLSAFGLAHLLRSLSGRAVRGLVVLLVLGSTAADLWFHQRRQVPLVDWEEWTAPIETVDLLREQAEADGGPWRYHALDSAYIHRQVHHLSNGWSGDLSHYVALRDLLQPSSNLIHDLESPDGYSNLVPSHYEAVWGSEKVPGLAVPSGAPRGPEWVTHPHVARLLRLFNVRYVTSAWPLHGDDFRRLASTRDGIQVYEAVGALPRSFVVGAVQRVRSDAEAIRILRGGDFDPEAVALIHDVELELPPGSRSSSNVRVVEYSPQRVVVETDTEAPGLLVLSDGHYPGWEAMIDEHTATIVRANVMMRSAMLPAGRHEVTFQFEPASVSHGIRLTLVGLVLWLVAVFVERRWTPSGNRYPQEQAPESGTSFPPSES